LKKVKHILYNTITIILKQIALMMISLFFGFITAANLQQTIDFSIVIYVVANFALLVLLSEKSLLKLSKYDYIFKKNDTLYDWMDSLNQEELFEYQMFKEKVSRDKITNLISIKRIIKSHFKNDLEKLNLYHCYIEAQLYSKFNFLYWNLALVILIASGSALIKLMLESTKLVDNINLNMGQIVVLVALVGSGIIYKMNENRKRLFLLSKIIEDYKYELEQ
jgi:hypothetical protein